jgi:hypothetical protein
MRYILEVAQKFAANRCAMGLPLVARLDYIYSILNGGSQNRRK